MLSTIVVQRAGPVNCRNCLARPLLRAESLGERESQVRAASLCSAEAGNKRANCYRSPDLLIETRRGIVGTLRGVLLLQCKQLAKVNLRGDASEALQLALPQQMYALTVRTQ